MKEVAVEDVNLCWPSPERVVLVTSVDAAVTPNIITVGWKMRVNSDPPVFAVALNQGSRSCANITATREFVIAVPGGNLAEAAMFCGRTSGRDVSKFEETGLTPRSAREVKPPLITECLSNIECRVTATQDMADHRVFFGEALAYWRAEREDGRVLLTIGDQPGCEMLFEEGRFRLGVVGRGR